MTETPTRLSNNEVQYILSEVHRTLPKAYQESSGSSFEKSFVRSIVQFVTDGYSHRPTDISYVGMMNPVVAGLFSQVTEVLDVFADSMPNACSHRLTMLKRSALSVSRTGFATG